MAPSERLRGQGDEVRAIVSLSDGSLLEVLGLRFTRFGPYGYVENTWLLERAAFAQAGATIEDVSEVVIDFPADNDLTWQELGFDLQ